MQAPKSLYERGSVVIFNVINYIFDLTVELNINKIKFKIYIIQCKHLF